MPSTTKQPIGITFPIRHGPLGYFNQSFDVVEQVSNDLIALLSTKKGERRLNNDFGTDLWSVIFEANGESVNSLIESIIKREVSKWMSYVTVKSVNVTTNDTDKDKNYVRVSVTYVADSLGIISAQTIDINLAQNLQTL